MLVIRSGGQTGVDRAALDAAEEHGLKRKGWCPEGGWAEDHPNPPGLLSHYSFLRETPSSDPNQRTEWNVRDSDRTIALFDVGGIAASGGTQSTIEFARRFNKPVLMLKIDQADALKILIAWLGEGEVNFAGPRESEQPGIYSKARSLISRALAARE